MLAESRDLLLLWVLFRENEIFGSYSEIDLSVFALSKKSTRMNHLIHSSYSLVCLNAWTTFDRRECTVCPIMGKLVSWRNFQEKIACLIVFCPFFLQCGSIGSCDERILINMAKWATHPEFVCPVTPLNFFGDYSTRACEFPGFVPIFFCNVVQSAAVMNEFWSIWQNGQHIPISHLEFLINSKWPSEIVYNSTEIVHGVNLRAKWPHEHV